MREIKCTLSQLEGYIQRDIRRIQRADHTARFVTAQRAARLMRARVPKAFGELQESINGFSDGGSGNPATVADAPHAAAVEIGSEPHWPDMEALVRWVKLRGMQGLTKKGHLRRRFAKALGPTTPRQARRVGQMILGEHKAAGGKGPPSVDDYAEKVAMAIARGIAEHGTRPHWYAKNTVPEAGKILLEELTRRIKI